MTKMIQNLVLLAALTLSLCSVALAQQPTGDKIPVKIQIVISRYDGDRKISSLPFTLLATANGGNNCSLRIGAQVPVPTTAGAYTYQSVGTDIDCRIATEAGRYKLDLTINDKSVIEARTTTPAAASAAQSAPSFRSFTYNNSISMKEGETKQFVSAADKSNGEAVKVDVTLTLDK
ncbi:MAG TPA: hypothetical protein VK210_16005 [Terriglobia bacterium]|nr:hypothetical protein [Terriglobia bacterium]